MKRIETLLLIMALVIPFMACDKLSLKDPEVTKLEERVAELSDKIAKLEAANTKLVEEKAISDKRIEILQKDVADVLAIAKTYRETIEKLVPERVQAIYQVDFKHNKLYNNESTLAMTKDILALVNKHDRSKVKIKVEGYASKAGDAKINKWFSKERAEGVAHKLFSAGIGESIVEIIAHGETDDNERKVVVTVEVLE